MRKVENLRAEPLKSTTRMDTHAARQQFQKKYLKSCQTTSDFMLRKRLKGTRTLQFPMQNKLSTIQPDDVHLGVRAQGRQLAALQMQPP